MLKDKLMTPEQAVALIKDGDTFTLNGISMTACAGWILPFIEKSFLETGHPANLTLCGMGGIGYVRAPGYDYLKSLVHDGLLKKLISVHLAAYQSLNGLIAENKIPAYNISQGVMSILLSEMAAGKKGYYTKVGLHTSQDPRYGGGCLNPLAEAEPLVTLAEQDGEECLFFKGIPSDVAFLQASYADEYGNISFEDEAMLCDPLDMAMATKNHGGKVIVLVNKFIKGHANAKLVHIPCYLVDAIVQHGEYYQCLPGVEINPGLSGQAYCSDEEAYAVLNRALNADGRRKAADFHIARRAALEFEPNMIGNLGIGIPQLAAMEGQKLGTIDSSVHMTLEVGVCGGVIMAVPFGSAMNPHCIHNQASMFRFYEGGGLDIGLLGALQVDKHGNVNVSRTGPKETGVGGFNFITHGAKKLVFCFKFLNSASFKIVDGELVRVPGVVSKIVDDVEAISFNAEHGHKMGKKVLYVTERCVFELGENGLVLTEIAPGFDLEKDILAYLSFKPEISPNLKEMPAICFQLDA